MRGGPSLDSLPGGLLCLPAEEEGERGGITGGDGGVTLEAGLERSFSCCPQEGRGGVQDRQQTSMFEQGSSVRARRASVHSNGLCVTLTALLHDFSHAPIAAHSC
ncbi:hypothetical protein OJAV_G00177780 [Oryzias javanicus]|uniref:Uncharacterized protein n=1 Tax=Oryzias javanicus TaxID=123683 RepID=A0A437CBW9_ORYJA|nr:hypothetical protein OJAV_G00177780 [Oryzias javanicus]